MGGGSGPRQNNEIPVAQKPQEQEESTLAPVAKLILEEGFRNPDFVPLMDQIVDVCNKLYKGDYPKAHTEADEEKVKEMKRKDYRYVAGVIDGHMKNLEQYYKPEVVDLMRNYFDKLKASLNEAVAD
jgi:hypothetical protein